MVIHVFFPSEEIVFRYVCGEAVTKISFSKFQDFFLFMNLFPAIKTKKQKKTHMVQIININ